MYIIFLAVVFFYFILPVSRSVLRQFYWRNIRKRILKASTYPVLEYEGIDNWNCAQTIFFGQYESMGSSGGFWVENQQLSLFLEGNSFPCFLLPSLAGRDNGAIKSYRPVSMQRLKAFEVEKISSTLSSPRVMTAGKTEVCNGRLCMVPEMVVLYEGRKERLLERSLDASSPRYSLISFSNFFSYGFAVLSFFLLSYYIAFVEPFTSRASVILSLSFAFMPIFFFCPPVVFFLFLFRREDKKLRRNLYKIYLNRMLGGDSQKKRYLNAVRAGRLILSGFYLLLLYASSFLLAFLLINFFA